VCGERLLEVERVAVRWIELLELVLGTEPVR